MNESGKHEVYKEKLSSICEENNLTYSLRCDRYPCTLTIKPLGGMDAQLTMLESDDVSYISPDASIVFAYIDGELSIKTSETFTISDALLSKIKRLFKNLYAMWTQFFFRDILVRGVLQAGDFPVAAEAWTGDDEEDEPGDDAPAAAEGADFDEFFEGDDRDQDDVEE